MFQIKIIFLTLCGLLHHIPVINAVGSEWMPANISPFVDQEIQDALMFSHNAVAAVEEYIQYKLPAEAKADGEVILRQFREGIANCESLIKTVVNIWEYKQCGSALLRDTMAALAALQQNYRPYTTSSATRPTLFW